MELMIVVAIIGVLAAVAIPSLMVMQLKAKRAELPANVSGLKISVVAYESVLNSYPACEPSPREKDELDKAAVAFDTTREGWSGIGWRPDGPVRGSYEVQPSGSADFVVTGTSDIDDDNVGLAAYTASLQTNASIRDSDRNFY